MNRNLYRIIFNRARGILMVVAEIVVSRRKGIGSSRCRRAGSGHRQAAVNRLTFAIWAALGMVWWVAPLAQAQIVADTSAPANQRPTIVNAANGVPLVNIQTPSAAGVSRNTYSQFDVDGQGAILNNARTSTATQLGGWVQCNPWLAGGAARVILNEVNSSNPSLLNGYVEVAGSRAQVVIANPAGIACDGCGFINADRATLTTGTPVIKDGNLDAYLVQRGAVTIQGAGLDASQTDYTDIIARSVEVNAGLWAQNLQLTTGANRVDADSLHATPITGTGTAPVFGVDVAQLGGMYAGKITLVGTEAGVGVRNAAQIGASVGEVIITADGRLENTGDIAGVTGLQVDTAGGVVNTGVLIAGQHLSIDSTSLSGDGKVLSVGDMTVRLTTDYTHTGEFQANGVALLETTGALVNQSTLFAGDSLTLRAAGIDNQASGQVAADLVRLETTGSSALTNRGLIDGGQETVVQSLSFNNLGTGRVFGDHVLIDAATVTNEAEAGVAPVIAARSRLDMSVQTLNNREHALIFSAGDLAIGGAVDELNRATGQADTVSNRSATIEALGGLDLSARQVNNTNEHFSTQVVETGRGPVQEYQRVGSPNRWLPNQISLFWSEVWFLSTPEGASDNWLFYDYTRVTTETQIQTSDPAQILSGGAMHISADAVFNDKSRIIAGGSLIGDIGTLTNSEVAGQRTFVDSGAVTNYYRIQEKGQDSQGAYTAGYRPAPTVQAITLRPSAYQQNTTPSGTGTQVGAFVPSTGINNSLFRQNPDASAGYFIETDPRFADFRSWLSSDYLLQQLSVDPATTQKRLGDGFYEQKLVREQVAQLTGRRFLDGYGSDEAQYRALLDNGATYAEQWNLRPGIALSAEQIAQLTSDIVWLVEKDVTLPDGGVTKALVPQVYVRVQDGDLDGSGALIAGDTVELKVSGDLTNEGTIAGRRVVSLTAENVRNLGGRISGEELVVRALTDIDNMGGVMQAMQRLIATAGRDLNVASTTADSQTSQGSRTSLSRVAGLYVSGEGGSLVATAGRDVNLNAATIVNSGIAGTTVIAAGNDLNLGTVAESHRQTIVWDDKNYRQEGSRTDIGTTIQASGHIALGAGNGLNAKAATVISDQGAVYASAGGDVNITTGVATRGLDEAHEVTGSNSYVSKKTIKTRDTLNETGAIASTFSGAEVHIESAADLTVQGSNVVATDDVTLAAGRDLNLTTAENRYDERHLREETKRGVFLSGTPSRPSVTAGRETKGTDEQQTGISHQTSTIGSVAGSVTLDAKRDVKVAGAQLQAAKDVDISGRNVDIRAVVDTLEAHTLSYIETSGLSVGARSNVTDTIAKLKQSIDRGEDVEDDRLKALYAARAAYAVKDLEQIIQASQKNGQGAGASARVSISLGTSRQESESHAQMDTVHKASAAAGGALSVTARGDDTPEQGDILLRGTALQGDTIALDAARDLITQSQAAVSRMENTDRKVDAQAGLYAGGSVSGNKAQGGLGLYGSVAYEESSTRMENLVHEETTITADNKLTLKTARDANLTGTVARADTIEADIGRNLTLTSEQDRDTYDSSSAAGEIEGRYAFGNNSGVDVSLSYSKTQSTWQSVQEQTGLFAGQGGFDVTVGAHTQLNGAVIASNAAADRNRLSTDTLGVLALQNTAEYSAESASISVGTAGGGLAPGGELLPWGYGMTPGIGVPVHEKSASTTRSAIAAGNVTVRADAETGRDSLTGISRDTTSANVTQERIFDAEKVAEQQEFTRVLSEVGFRAVGDIASSRTRSYEEAEARKEAAQKALGKASDPQQRAALEQIIVDADATIAAEQDQYDKWKDGGAYKIALHALVGAASGDVAGGSALTAGLTAGVNEAKSPLISKITQDLDKSERKLVHELASLATGTALGGEQGAAIALNADLFNRQLHESEKQRLRQLAKGDQAQEQRLAAAACALVNCYAEFPTDSAEYRLFKAMADEGAKPEYAAERQLLSQQVDAQGGQLFSYNNSLIGDRGIDTAKRLENEYQITTRALGGVQAVGGVLGAIQGSAITAAGAATCAPTAGAGCVAAAGGVLLTGYSIDVGYAGATALVTGLPPTTLGGQIVSDVLGVSPATGELIYGLAGLTPAAIEAHTINTAVNAQKAANAAARESHTVTQSADELSDVANNKLRLFANQFPEDAIGMAKVVPTNRLSGISGNFNYVVREDGVLVVGRSGHTSLTGGAPVQAAGEVQLYNGSIKWIDNASGHYQPLPNAAAIAENAFNDIGLKATGTFVPKVWVPDPKLPNGGSWKVMK